MVYDAGYSLEPYGAQVLGLSVGDDVAHRYVRWRHDSGADSDVVSTGKALIRSGGLTGLVGIMAFAFVILSAPFRAPALFGLGQP